MRSLKIHTHFFQEEDPTKIYPHNQQENKVQLRKITAAIAIQNKLRTLQLMRLFNFWGKMKYLKQNNHYSPSSVVSGKSDLISSRHALERYNIAQIKQFNKSYLADSSLIRKKYKSESPTSSNSGMNQSRALILHEIAQKIKLRKVKTRQITQNQEGPLYRRLGKLQQMLTNLQQKKQVKPIDKFIQIEKSLNKQVNLDVNTLCLMQIQKLKAQINEIKNQQNKFIKQAKQMYIENDKYRQRQKSCLSTQTKSIKSQLLENNNKKDFINTHRVQFSQPIAYIQQPQIIKVDYQPTHIVNSKSHLYFKPLQMNNLPSFNCCHKCLHKCFHELPLQRHSYVKPISVIVNPPIQCQTVFKPVKFNNFYPYKIMTHSNSNIKFLPKQTHKPHQNNTSRLSYKMYGLGQNQNIKSQKIMFRN